MSARVGTDIIEVARVAKAIGSERFVRRVFTAAERRYCESRGNLGRAASYAARWAAKESLLKALGTGLADGRLVDVEVVNDASGQPRVRLHGALAERATLMGATAVSLSMSHTREFATAVCVMEVNSEGVNENANCPDGRDAHD